MRERIELLIGLVLVLLDEVRDGLSRRERAQGVVEYMAVVVGVVAAALVVLGTFTGVLEALGTRVATLIGGIGNGTPTGK